jgi:hypothetical protein
MDKVEIPPLRGVFAQPWSVRKVLGLLAVFGPAAIVASVSIGAGETIVVVRMGAWAGYGLLWLVLLSALVKGVFVTYLLGRYTAVSGEPIAHRLVRLPGPRGWLPLALVGLELSAAPMAWVAIAKPCADLCHFVVQDWLPGGISEPVWENLFCTGLIGLALAMSLSLSFVNLEKQQVALCLIMVAGTAIGTLMVRPDYARALLGCLRFGQIPDFPAWAPEDAIKHPLLTMTTTFGYVGGGVLGYVVYASWVGMHGWGLTGHGQIEAIRRRAAASARIDYLPEDPEQAGRMRRLLAPLRWDVGMGAVVLFVVTAAFMLSGAAVLYPLQTRFEGWGLLTNQAHIWAAIHPALVWIYYLCVIAALWGTLQALPEIYTRVIQECFQAVWPATSWDYRALQRVLCLYLFAAALVFTWSDLPFDTLVQIASFVLANLAIALAMVAALYLNFQLPPAYRTRLPVLMGGLVSAGVLWVVAGVGGWGLAAKLLGN